MDKTTRNSATVLGTALSALVNVVEAGSYITIANRPDSRRFRDIKGAADLLKRIGNTEPTTDADVLAAIDRFDNAAQSWGWEADQGSGDDVPRAKAEYEEARNALVMAISLRGTVRQERTLRNGATVVILCEDAPGDFPIVGYFIQPGKTEISVMSWNAEGHWTRDNSYVRDEWDLMPLPVAQPDPIDAAAQRLRTAINPLPGIGWQNLTEQDRNYYRNLARIARSDDE